MSIADIEAIVKEHYETGIYGSAHFLMPAAVKGRVERRFAPPPPSQPHSDLGADHMARVARQLMGIPVVVDETPPPGEWRIVDNRTGEILRCGVVPAEDER